MSADMKAWSKIVKDAVSWLANEEAQRRAWFGIGPEIDSPDEAFNGFFNDAAIEDYIQRKDTGLNDVQLEELVYLVKIMNKLSDETPSSIDREIGPSFIDDPRWREVIEAAKRTQILLCSPL